MQTKQVATKKISGGINPPLPVIKQSFVALITPSTVLGKGRGSKFNVAHVLGKDMAVGVTGPVPICSDLVSTRCHFGAYQWVEMYLSESTLFVCLSASLWLVYRSFVCILKEVSSKSKRSTEASVQLSVNKYYSTFADFCYRLHTSSCHLHCSGLGTEVGGITMTAVNT